MEHLYAALRQADYDRYLSVLYAPEAKRSALTAIYGFNAEIAAVRDRIHEPLPGEVRLQWWRDVINAGGPEAAAGHPLAMALIDAIHTHRLPTSAFDNMIEARIFDLYDDPMPSRDHLEGYLGETASALIQLAALILDQEAAASAAELAGHAGCAQGIAGLLRLTPTHRVRGQCYVPAEVLAAAGVNADRFIAASDPPADERAIAAMVALGREHWGKFRDMAGVMHPALRPAFIAAGLSPAYLAAVEKIGYGATVRVADIAGWRRHWLVYRAASGKWAV